MGFTPPPLIPRKAFNSDKEWYLSNLKEIEGYSRRATTLKDGLITILVVAVLLIFVTITYSWVCGQ
jgi:hypothetical protein